MKQVRISVPGKVMLAGEYAVLRGGHSLAVTVDRRMIIDVQYDPEATSWTITSNIWDQPREVADLKAPQSDPLCRAVQASAKRHGLHGGTVVVQSNINIADGVGSSSALRLGICSAFQLLKHDRDPRRPSGIAMECNQHAWALQTEIQGMASGYDIVTQYVGGLVEFYCQYDANVWTPKWFRHDLDLLQDLVHVFVGGSGAPTASTMHTTASWLEGGSRADRLIDTSENLIDAILNAIRWQSPDNFRRLMSCIALHRSMFAGNPHFPISVADALKDIPGLDASWSWKTTGAGGEDAILLFGTAKAIQPAAQALGSLGWHRLGAAFSTDGIRVDELSVSPLEASIKSSTLPRSGGGMPRRRL